MKTFSISYMLVITTAIFMSYAISSFIYRNLPLSSGFEICAIVAHGLAFVLFFHLIGKTAGLSVKWRIVVDATIPTLGFVIWHTLIRDRSADTYVFPATWIAVYYLVEFSIAAVVGELTLWRFENHLNPINSKPNAG